MPLTGVYVGRDIKWWRLFRDQAEALAERVVRQGLQDTDADLQRRLALATQENVQLITSIGEHYQQGITSLVTDAVMAGGDLGTLTQKLQSRYGVSERKATTIARDQTHKINQSVERQRCGELGLKEAYWRHVGGGRFSREDHRRADGKRYVVAEGCPISGEHIQPGQLVNCRCRADYIILGYND